MNSKQTPTFGHRPKLMALFLILSLVLSSVSNSIAAPPPPSEDVTFETMSLPPEAQSVPDGLTANSRASGNPKLDSTMVSLATAARVSAQEAIELARSRSLRLSGNRVHVQIVTHALGLENAVAAITGAGGEVTGVSNDDTLIQGWLPVDALETVSAQDDVYFIRRPAEVQLFENPQMDSSTTEGLAVINGPAWHTAGYTGSGVKIGVIDGGFLGYTSLLGADLPASVTVKNFVDGENDTQVDGSSKHGTACAEIIHDIAPGATLYLAKINTNVDLQEAVAWLKDTHQVDIISTSLGWYNLTPGDGTGEFADLVQSARNAGILWTTAASNDREAHWGGLYSDPDADNAHNFNDTQEVNYFGPGDGTPYSIPSGYLITAFLRWDDWTNVNQDYDMYLLRWNGASWDTIATGEDEQDGSPGQTPTEFAYAVTSGAATAYGFVIVRNSSTRNVNLEVFLPKVAPLDELLYARSLSNLADTPDAMTVAALDVTSPYPQESYSSEGPTNGPGGAATGGFTKPDISGFANVATESYTGSTFNGTSSATPHVAGAAALVLSAYPSYTPDQLQSFLEGRAVDMGTAGIDTIYGNGRLYLGDPPGAIAGKIWNGSVSNDWHTADNWTPSGAPMPADDVLIPNVTNDPVISTGDAAVNSLTINSGAIVDLTNRTLTVEGTLTNNGTLKQTQDVAPGDSTEFLRITNLAGNLTKYYGVDIAPAGAANVALDAVAVLGTPLTRPAPGASVPQVVLALDGLPNSPSEQFAPSALQAGVGLILDDGSVEGAIGVNNSVDGFQFIWLNRFTPAPADFPFELEYISVVFGSTGVSVGDAVDLLVYADTDGDGDPSDASLLATYNETVQVTGISAWNNYTLTSPLLLSGPGDVLIGVINRYQPGTGGGLIDHPAAEDRTATQYRSWVGWWTTEPAPDPAVLPPDNAWGIIDDLASTYAGNWMIRGYGSAVTGNTPPTIADLPDQQLPVNDFANNAIDLWAYTSDTESPDDALTFSIDNTPAAGAGVRIDSNRYIDIFPDTDWTGQTDVVVRVTDPEGLFDTDSFQVTITSTVNTPPAISDLPDITVTVNSTSILPLIDLWNYADDAEDSDDALTFTIANTPDPDAGVIIDSNRYILVVPATDWVGVTDVEIQVQDTGGLTDTDVFQVVVTGTVNTPPIISDLPDQWVPVNGAANNAIDLWAYTSDTESPDDALTFSIDNTPAAGAGVHIDSNRYIDIFPETDWTGQTDVIVRVTDPEGLFDTDSFQVTVTSTVNTPPAISDLPDIAVTVNSSANNAIDLWAYASDTESPNDALTFSIDNIPAAGAGVHIDSNRYIDIFPETDWTGHTDVVVRVTDPGGLFDTDDFQVTVTSTVNTPPTIAGLPDQTVPVNGSANNAIDLWAYASDGESPDDALTFSIDNTPAAGAGVSIDSNRYIDIFPQTDWAGQTDVVVRVTDPGGLFDTDDFQVTVTSGVTVTSVTVAISGNQFCANRTTGVKRCFDIDPATPISATVRFYFLESERNGQSLNDLLVFRYDGDWIEEPGPYTRGGAGDAQYVEAQNVDDFSLFVLDSDIPDSYSVYLPLVIKRWPPVPDTPVLNPISNADGDGNYAVTWSAAYLADTYTLQESSNAAFTSPTTRYTGSGTSWSASNKPTGTYYYRVRASQSWEGQQLYSGWSTVQSVKVSPPTTFYATEDAVVTQKLPSYNTGNTTDMWVGYGKGACIGASSDLGVTRSLVKFNLSAVPAGASISSAKLYLRLGGWCRGSNTSPRSVTTYRTSSGWSESSVTWNNMPGFAEAYGSTAVGYPSSPTWYAFDVTNLVRGWVNGSLSNYGLTIRGPEGSGSDFAWFGFFTSETAYDPYIRITYAGMAASESETTPAPLVYDGGVETLPGIFINTPFSDGFGSFGQAVCSPLR